LDSYALLKGCDILIGTLLDIIRVQHVCPELHM